MLRKNCAALKEIIYFSFRKYIVCDSPLSETIRDYYFGEINVFFLHMKSCAELCFGTSE